MGPMGPVAPAQWAQWPHASRPACRAASRPYAKIEPVGQGSKRETVISGHMISYDVLWFSYDFIRFLTPLISALEGGAGHTTPRKRPSGRKPRAGEPSATATRPTVVRADVKAGPNRPARQHRERYRARAIRLSCRRGEDSRLPKT